jgi:hypothetical protein
MCNHFSHQTIVYKKDLMFCLYKAFEKDNVFSTMGKIFVCLAVARQYMGMRAGEDGFHF